MKLTILSGMLFVTVFAGAASAAPQIDWIWSDATARVQESSNAAIYTPVERPMNAVQWKWDKVEAQQAIDRALPRDRQVVQPIEVVRQHGIASGADELSEVDLRERIANPRRILVDESDF